MSPEEADWQGGSPQVERDDFPKAVADFQIARNPTEPILLVWPAGSALAALDYQDFPQVSRPCHAPDPLSEFAHANVMTESL